MSKTFKTCAIFSITAVWLVLMRMIFGEVNLSDNVSDWLFSCLVQIIGLGLVPLLLFKFWVKEDIKTGFAFKVKLNPLIYVLAILIGLTLHILIIGVSVIWQNVAIMMGYTPTNGSSVIYSGAEVLIMSVLTTAILPGICEEITYRGLGMQMFETTNDKFKILMTALLFGLGHQFILQTGYAFVAGLVLGFLAVKTRSIIPGIIVHFLNNCLSVISEYSEQKGGAYFRFEDKLFSLCFDNWGAILLTVVIASAATYGLLILVKKVMGEQQQEITEKNGTYYYPQSVQYVDEIFGKSFYTDAKIRTGTTAWYEYAFLYGALALMTATTVISFIWGAMR